MKKISVQFFVWITILLCNNLYAQDLLQQKLGTSTDFGFIKKTVLDYYSQQIPLAKNNSELKKMLHEQKMWARWLWYNEGRLDEHNQVTNVAAKNFEAILNQKIEKASAGSQNLYYGGWSNITLNDVVDINNNSIHTGIGRVTCIAFHPTDANTFYVGTLAGGVWKTSNGGASYAPFSDELASLGVASIVVNQGNPSEIYVLTGDGDSDNAGGWFIPSFGYIRWSAGLFKSTDGGATWNKTGLSFNTSQKISAFKLIQDPSNPYVLLAAMSDGIYRTTDDAVTFTKVSVASYISDLRFKEGNSNIVFAAKKANNALLRVSTDNGQNFYTVTNNLPSTISRMTFATTPADPNKLYVLCGASVDSSHFVGLYRSSDDGASFTLMNDTPNVLSNADNGHSPDYYDEVPAHLTIAVNPSTGTNLITGCVKIWRSANSGTTLTFSGGTHADIHQIAYNPLNNVAYAATDGGIYKSTDNGTTWTFNSISLNCATYYHLAGLETDAARLLGGLQDDGTALRTSGSTFYSVGGGDGFAAAINPKKSSTHYIGGNTGVYRSIDGGLHNTDVTPPFYTGNNAQFYPAILMHPSDTNIIYTGFTQVCRTDNRGGSWYYTGAKGNWSLAVSIDKPNRLYAAGGDAAYGTLNGGLYRNENNATPLAWVTLSNKPGFPATFGKITDIAVNPNDADDVWVTFGGFFATTKVAHSTDAGANWVELHGTLPNVPVNCATFDNNGNVYIGTDIGVYYRGTTDTDWKPFYNGLPRIPVTDLVINVGAAKIRAATFGRGIFESDLYAACVSALTLNGFYIGQRTYSAASTVTSTGTISSSAGTEVFIKAGGYVDLLPGFIAQSGTFLKAKIGPCVGGVDSTSLIEKSYKKIKTADVIIGNPNNNTLKSEKESANKAKQKPVKTEAAKEENKAVIEDDD